MPEVHIVSFGTNTIHGQVARRILGGSVTDDPSPVEKSAQPVNAFSSGFGAVEYLQAVAAASTKITSPPVWASPQLRDSLGIVCA